MLFLGAALPVQAQDGQRRILAVSVINQKDGNPVPGLTVANFHGELHEKPVKILSVAEDTGSRHIALVVDTSRGMGNDRTRWGFAWDAAEDLVVSLTPENKFVFLTVADHLQEHTDLSSDLETLRSALHRLRESKAAGPTALYDGVIRTAKAFYSPGFADVICLITDGVDTASTQSTKEAETVVARAGLRVFVIWVRPAEGYTAGRDIRLASRWMARMAEMSGGFVLRPRSYKRDRVAQELSPLLGLVTHVYRIEVEFPCAVEKPTEWKLEVVDADGKKRKNVDVSYARLLVPLEKPER
jgi:hypothetical protein